MESPPQELKLSATEKKREKRRAFWQRRYSGTPTTGQLIFDVLFGAVVPIVLLVIDPAVFKVNSPIICEPMQWGNVVFGYGAIGLGILSLLVWLFVPTVRPVGAAFLCGILFAGWLFSGAVGLALAPLSTVALLLLNVVAFLGYFPIVTAFVYRRNGQRAFQVAMQHTPNRVRRFASMGLGALFVLGLPWLAQAQFNTVLAQATTAITQGNDVDAATNTLKTVSQLCVSLCNTAIGVQLREASTKFPDRENVLSGAYIKATGATDLPDFCGGPSAGD